MESEVLVIIPTHNHPETITYSIASAQNQSIENIRIVILGDGVSDDTRDALRPVVTGDSRVTFVDNPKGERHGEHYRHELILNSDSKYISYLGDDDLLFKNHLESLLDLVDGVDFVNPLPAIILPDGNVYLAPADLSEESCIDWHLAEGKLQNTVSLTGVLHTRESYLRLDKGWHPAPENIFTDLHMWQHYFKLENFQARTSPYATTAKFAADLRKGFSSSVREREIASFWEEMQRDDFQNEWDKKIHAALFRAASQHFLESSLRLDQLQLCQNDLLAVASHFETVSAELNLEIAQKSNRINEIENSKSWKATRILRSIHKIINR